MKSECREIEKWVSFSTFLCYKFLEKGGLELLMSFCKLGFRFKLNTFKLINKWLSCLAAKMKEALAVGQAKMTSFKEAR